MLALQISDDTVHKIAFWFERCIDSFAVRGQSGVGTSYPRLLGTDDKDHADPSMKYSCASAQDPSIFPMASAVGKGEAVKALSWRLSNCAKSSNLALGDCSSVEDSQQLTSCGLATQQCKQINMRKSPGWEAKAGSVGTISSGRTAHLLSSSLS